MVRAKREELVQDVSTSSQPQDPQAELPVAEAAGFTESSEPRKSNWVTKFGSWGDYEAGVRLIEDRKNRWMTIQFGEKPSDAVRAVLKSQEHGYRFDPEDKVWYKPISQTRPRQSREEAEQLALEVTNIIRAEKGLEQRQSFAITA